MNPIWKDFILTLGETPASAVDFDLQDDNNLGVTLYSGRAYTRPGQTIPQARINDIVASQLRRGLTIIGETDVPYFFAYISAVGEGVIYEYEKEFYADWSYDPGFDVDTDLLNVPICDILLPGQWVPCTMRNSTTASFFITHTEAEAGDFNEDFNHDFLISGDVVDEETVANGGVLQTAWFSLRNYPTATKVEVDGRTYRVGGGCRQYALYYVNAYGGWDTFPVRANTQESDAVTHHTTEREYDNSTPSARGRSNFVNELQHKYVFHSHPLTLEQSLRMHHLLNSPCVYLHDIVANVIRPVVLTGSTTEYKRDGGLYQYTIEAELAQDRIRR